MSIKVEVIAHSIGPNKAEIFTVLALYPRFIHSEVLRHRNVSHSVASSRAIPAKVLMEQVKDRPADPILWPLAHKGMQGTDLASDTMEIEQQWNQARRNAVQSSDRLTELGLSKQLTNRLIEPWVECRDVMTFTRGEIEGFFRLRHPWHYVEKDMAAGLTPEPYNERATVWEDEVNLKFPAEYNIQALAIEMKKAMDESTPVKLKHYGAAGQWHLPFITDEDKQWFIDKYDIEKQGSVDPDTGCHESGTFHNDLIKLSAARCAMTSYNTNKGRSIETELDLADRLMKDHHWSPFEHQAQAIKSEYWSDIEHLGTRFDGQFDEIPKGMQLRISNDMSHSLWSNNFQGIVQARALLDT